MRNDDIPSGWRTQVWVGIFWAVAGSAAIGFDVFNNWRFGAKLSPFIGGVFAFAAILVGVLHGQDWGSRASRLFCLAVTIGAAYAGYTTDLSGALGSSNVQRNLYKEAVVSAEAARKKLDGIKEDGAVIDLESRHQLLDAATKAICDPHPTWENCKKKADELKTILDRLSLARTRDKAEATLREANATIARGPGESLATTSAGDKGLQEIAGIPIIYMIVGAILITQIGALRMMAGIEGIREGWRMRAGDMEAEVSKQKEKEAAVATEEIATSAEQRKKDIKRELAQKTVLSKDQEELTFDKMLLWIDDEPDLEKKGCADSRRALAERLAVHENTLKRYLGFWGDRKLITVHKVGKTKIRIEVHEVWTPLTKPVKLRAVS